MNLLEKNEKITRDKQCTSPGIAECRTDFFQFFWNLCAFNLFFSEKKNIFSWPNNTCPLYIYICFQSMPCAFKVSDRSQISYAPLKTDHCLPNIGFLSVLSDAALTKYMYIFVYCSDFEIFEKVSHANALYWKKLIFFAEIWISGFSWRFCDGLGEMDKLSRKFFSACWSAFAYFVFYQAGIFQLPYSLGIQVMTWNNWFFSSWKTT